MKESDRLLEHKSHYLEIVTYADENVALECLDCSEVILDYNY